MDAPDGVALFFSRFIVYPQHIMMTSKATNTQNIPQSMKWLSCTHNFIAKFVTATTMKNYYEFKNEVHQKKRNFFFENSMAPR